MARQPKPQPASQRSVDALTSKVDALADGMKDLKATVIRVAADFDRRLAKTASVEMLSDVKATVGRHTAVLDRISGDLTDARGSLTIFGAMHTDHRLRLDSHAARLGSLESRIPPAAP